MKNMAVCLLFFTLLLTSCGITPEISSASATPLKIVPSTDCPFQSAPVVTTSPGDLYNKKALATSQFSDKNFTFDFWLYCDPILQPSAIGESYSAIPSLGMLVAWKYTGSKIDGHNTDFWGFEPNIKNATSWDGPLYKAESRLMTGISVEEQIALNNIQNGTPFRYHVGVESSLGINGAIFSFILKNENGVYIISDITVDELNP